MITFTHDEATTLLDILKEKERMITFTRDEATTLLDILIASADAQQWELDDHIIKYGEWYRPERIAFMKEYIQKTDQQITALRHKLNTPLEPIRPTSGGIGRHPDPEPKIDGWVGLTDKEIGDIYRAGWSNNMSFAHALEVKLREKNNG